MTTILIVEDDVFIREIAVLTAEESGYLVLSAGDLNQAICLLRSDQPIDGLFTDIRLKTAILGGYQLAQEAIVIRPRLRVIYATGSLITEEMRAMFVRGARALQKPYAPHQLAAALLGLFGAPA